MRIKLVKTVSVLVTSTSVLLLVYLFVIDHKRTHVGYDRQIVRSLLDDGQRGYNYKRILRGENGSDHSKTRFNLTKRLLPHSLVPSNATRWEYEGMIFLDSYFPSLPIEYIIENKNVCSDVGRVHLLIYVHSSPKNVIRRQALRNTWANSKIYGRNNITVRTIFLLGKPKDDLTQFRIMQEDAEHRDIVQGSFIDMYQHLTTKAIMGLQWTTENCANADFVLKTDDDVFVNLFDMFKSLNFGRNKPHRLIMCNAWREGSMSILRDPSSCKKWCVSENQFYGASEYPRYCAGLAFIMSSDIVPTLFYTAASTPYFHIDDMYVTGMLPRGIENVNYLDIRHKYHVFPNNRVDKLRELAATKSVIHDSDIKHVRLLWDMVLESLKLMT